MARTKFQNLKITVREKEFLYILICKILTVDQKEKSFGLLVYGAIYIQIQTPTNSVMSRIYLATVFPKYLKSDTVWMDLRYDCSSNTDVDMCMYLYFPAFFSSSFSSTDN
jgi:hypothetical protein